jgi:transcriptional regulator with GAF, ATPase, and Fis domain
MELECRLRQAIFFDMEEFGGKGSTVQPKLSTLSGPLRKTEFPLETEVSIGSASSNQILLEEPAVSPHHCRITVENGRFFLMDLESISGTFVNGMPVKQRELDSGDEIAVGDSVFLFQTDVSRATSNPLQLDDGPEVSPPSQQFHRDELLYLHPESLVALPQSERLSRNLRVLLRISTGIGTIRDVESLQWALLGMIFDVIPAERGAVLLVKETSLEVLSHVAWDRLCGPDHPVHVSQALIRKVIGERVFLLDSPFPGGEARESANCNVPKSAASVLCVPLVSGNGPIGVIYLDSRNPATPFTEDDLQLVSAVAGLAGIAIENARQFELLGTENQHLRAQASLEHDMVGRSARMREVYQFIERVAPSDSTVLVSGESGTGKELAARAIHKNSNRKNQPFVALNCAALTETLLESELFGHEKGAFTSAITQKKGMIEVAEGGSLFLDEIGELSPILQAKLLRVLQEREFTRVGGTRSIRINVRFLAATNKDLPKAVKEGKFRADLFHRLNVISLVLPPLREHPEDIPVLAEYFAARYAKRCNRMVKGISPQARSSLLTYAWPGNVRELENAMERAVVIGSSDMILPEDLPDTLLESSPPGNGESSMKYHDAIRNLKRQLILGALEQTGGSFTQAAKLLGVHSNYLHRLINNLDLRLALKKKNQA